MECVTSGDWRMGVAMVDSVGDRLRNVMQSVGIISATGRIAVCYTGISHLQDLGL